MEKKGPGVLFDRTLAYNVLCFSHNNNIIMQYKLTW